MSEWLIERLRGDKEEYIPDSQFSFNSSVNWVRALRLECYSLTKDDIVKYYRNLNITQQEDDRLINRSLASLFTSNRYVNALKLIDRKDLSNGAISNIAIISWYYAVYNAAKAIICISGNGYQETHTATQKTFHNVVNSKFIMYPFDLNIKNLTKDSLNKIKTNGSKLNEFSYPSQYDAKLCLYSYLKGTAENYIKYNKQEKIKNSKEFKSLGVDNFRTKKAQELRDKILEKEIVNFLVQAFRFRGKANYRDSFYMLSLDKRIKDFIDDLWIVASKFLDMANYNVSSRIEDSIWESYNNNCSVAM